MGKYQKTISSTASYNLEKTTRNPEINIVQSGTQNVVQPRGQKIISCTINGLSLSTTTIFIIKNNKNPRTLVQNLILTQFTPAVKI